jgi:hypothetical protein
MKLFSILPDKLSSYLIKKNISWNFKNE